MKRLVGLILTRTGFKFCVMNPFLRSFYFVVLLRHTGFKQLMIQGLYIFCKEPMVRHRCWVRQLRLMKFNLPPKKPHKLTFEFSPSPLWPCQSESNLFGAKWGIVGKACRSRRGLHINDNHITKKAATGYIYPILVLTDSENEAW